MSTAASKGPAVPSPPVVKVWREAVNHALAEIDWRKIAPTPWGSIFVAGLVGGALHFIGNVLEAESLAKAEAARQAEAARVARPPLTAEDWRQIIDAAMREAEAKDAKAKSEQPSSEASSRNEGAAKAKSSPATDEKTEHAAGLLGVELDASEDQIRAALRSVLAASRLHPDQGGDGEEAKRLIAAKNHLIERARAVRA